MRSGARSRAGPRRAASQARRRADQLMAATIAPAPELAAGRISRNASAAAWISASVRSAARSDPDVPVAVARPDEDPLERRVAVEEVHPMAGLAADGRAARRQVVDLAVGPRPGLVRIEHDRSG